MAADQQDEFGEVHPDRQDPTLTEDEVLELLPGFALGTLEPDEMLAVERYLQSHPQAQSRLEAFELTAASLAHAAPRATLPVRAKERLMRRVRADAPAAPTRSNPLRALAAPPARPRMRGLRSIPRSQTRATVPTRNWLGIFGRSLAVAGAIATILLLAIITWQLRTRVEQLSTQLADVQGQVTNLQVENDRLQQRNETLETQVQRQVAVLINPEETITLAGQEPVLTASGRFYRRANTGVLVLHDLPPLADNQDYQLWISRPEGEILSAGVIEVPDAAASLIDVTLLPEHANLVGVGVSIEPEGGSPTPTTIVLFGILNDTSA
jgi:anti-sigma-K factor RskA